MKIAIVTTHMKLGGIRRSLLNFLNVIKDEGWVIDLFVLTGELENILKQVEEYHIDNVQIIKNTDIFYKTFNKQETFSRRIRKIIYGLMSRIVGREKVINKLISCEKKYGVYDIAISYANGIWTDGSRNFSGGCEFYVSDCIDAKRKIAWIHSNPKNLGFSSQICLRVYSRYDEIVNVSFGCKEIFDNICPKLKNKSRVIYNLCDSQKIKMLAQEQNPYKDIKGISIIVTVCRIDNKSKRIDRILDICSLLLDASNIEFLWYIVGEGKDRKLLEEMVKSRGLENVLKFVGMKENPYPYIKNADLFVLSSDYEAFPLSLKEALILKTPVVTTPIPSACEIVKDGVTGYIRDFSAESLALKIQELLRNKALLRHIKTNMEKEDEKEDTDEIRKLILNK